ncbi:Na+-transporting methylmalonyl-CoA/oxaloacetate decarboxylase%2C beta subunit [Dorea longicatena]|nr:Na+-transporting methylmalonyl-CoA/oxaloacetate decarboxylase%2C beta subunit [Dorea longicatena]
MYFIKRGNYNPVIGIAAVSCVPTTAKVAQKIVSKDNPNSFILGDGKRLWQSQSLSFYDTWGKLLHFR